MQETRSEMVRERVGVGGHSRTISGVFDKRVRFRQISRTILLIMYIPLVVLLRSKRTDAQ